MESFNLNIIPGKDRPVCHASQFDIGRTIRVNLFEGFNVFTLDGTEVISLSVRKPDGNVVTEAVTNTSDSYVEFVTTEQMTACHGSNLCELKLEKGADVIGTMNFILDVEQDPLEGGVQSASEIDNLQTQVAGMVATEVANQYDSANVIFDASPVPGHGNGYTVTSEGIATELALKQDATDANLQTTDTTVVGAINELLGDLGNKADAANTYTKTEVDTALAPLIKIKQQTVYLTNGTRIYIKRYGLGVQLEVNEFSTKTFSTSWVDLYTDNTYQTRAYIDSDLVGTASKLYVPIGLVNGNQLVMSIEKNTRAIQIICNTSAAIYPQGSGVYTLA